MITVDSQPHRITASVFGEFTIADYQEFERAALRALDTERTLDLLFDLTAMTGYTVDVAWEDIKFSRRHARDFERIAVVTTNQWTIWSAWLAQLFVDADMEVFESIEEARVWLEEPAGDQAG